MIGLVVYASTHLEFLSDRGNTWFHLAQVIGIVGAIGTLSFSITRYTPG